MNIAEFSEGLYETMMEKLSEIEVSAKDEISKESRYIEVIKSNTYGL